jgi:hypothetical protein
MAALAIITIGSDYVAFPRLAPPPMISLASNIGQTGKMDQPLKVCWQLRL